VLESFESPGGQIGDTIRCFLPLLERHPVRPRSCRLLELRLAISRNKFAPSAPRTHQSREGSREQSMEVTENIWLPPRDSDPDMLIQS